MRTTMRAIDKFLGEARHMASQVRMLAQSLEESAQRAQDLSMRFTHLGEHSNHLHGQHPSVGSRGARGPGASEVSGPMVLAQSPGTQTSGSTTPSPSSFEEAHASLEESRFATEERRPSRRGQRRLGPGSGFLLGAAIAGAVALMLAPASGETIRRRLGHQVKRLRPGAKPNEQRPDAALAAGAQSGRVE